MLRITESNGHGGKTLVLEGKLLAPWLEEVRIACDKAANGSAAVDLDMSGITYIDADGVELIRALVKRGVRITKCSSFVNELLQWRNHI